MASLAQVIQTNTQAQASPYWLSVQAMRAELAPKMLTGPFGKKFIHVTSIEAIFRGRIGGRVSEADLETAARCLAPEQPGGPSHRLATKPEIEQYKEDQVVRVKELKAIDDAQKSTTILKVQMEPSADGQTMELKPVADKPDKSQKS